MSWVRNNENSTPKEENSRTRGKALSDMLNMRKKDTTCLGKRYMIVINLSSSCVCNFNHFHLLLFVLQFTLTGLSLLFSFYFILTIMRFDGSYLKSIIKVK